MASAVDMAIQQAAQAVDTSGIGKNSTEGLQLGMSMAQRQAQIDQQRQTLQFQQQQHEMTTHDWLHGQLSSAMTESDPRIRNTLLDELNETFPKVFDGRRIQPGMLELMKKSPGMADRLMAVGRVRSAMLQGKPELVRDYDRQVLDGMTTQGVSEAMKQMSSIYGNEGRIVSSLTGAGVATPTAAAMSGQSPEGLQDSLNNSPRYINQKARLAVKLDDQAKAAGESFDSDKKLTQYFKQKAGIQRAIHTIESGGVINPQMKSEIENEISTAISGQGVAGEGKLSRVEFDTYATKAAGFLQKLENKPVDLKKQAPEVINYLKQTLSRLDEAYGNTMEEVAVGKAQNYAQTQNPKVSAVVKAKLQQYAPKYFAKTYGGGDGQSAQAVAPGSAPVNPATGEPSPGKITVEKRAQWRQQAIQKLQQIRSAPPGTLSTTEQDVKGQYKLLTGDELTE